MSQKHSDQKGNRRKCKVQQIWNSAMLKRSEVTKGYKGWKVLLLPFCQHAFNISMPAKDIVLCNRFPAIPLLGAPRTIFNAGDTGCSSCRSRQQQITVEAFPQHLSAEAAPKLLHKSDIIYSNYNCNPINFLCRRPLFIAKRPKDLSKSLSTKRARAMT